VGDSQHLPNDSDNKSPHLSGQSRLGSSSYTCLDDLHVERLRGRAGLTGTATEKRCVTRSSLPLPSRSVFTLSLHLIYVPFSLLWLRSRCRRGTSHHYAFDHHAFASSPAVWAVAFTFEFRRMLLQGGIHRTSREAYDRIAEHGWSEARWSMGRRRLMEDRPQKHIECSGYR